MHSLKRLGAGTHPKKPHISCLRFYSFSGFTSRSLQLYGSCTLDDIDLFVLFLPHNMLGSALDEQSYILITVGLRRFCGRVLCECCHSEQRKLSWTSQLGKCTTTTTHAEAVMLAERDFIVREVLQGIFHQNMELAIHWLMHIHKFHRVCRTPPSDIMAAAQSDKEIPQQLPPYLLHFMECSFFLSFQKRIWIKKIIAD